MSAATDPERFGWRFWLFSEEQGHFATPWSGESRRVDFQMSNSLWPKPFVTATCTSDHAVPSPVCVCGIHYTPGTDEFFTSLHNGFALENLDKKLVVAAFGVAGGAVMFDPQNGEWGGIRPRRAASFHVLGMVLPETSLWGPTLQDQFNIPVWTGLTIETARTVQNHCLTTFFLASTDRELDNLVDDTTTTENLAAAIRELFGVVADQIDAMTNLHSAVTELSNRVQALEEVR